MTEELTALRAHVASAAFPELRALVADVARSADLCFQVGPLYADLAKQPLDATLLAAGIAQAHAIDLPARIAELFDGAEVNTTERRPALHTLLRARPEDVAPAQQIRWSEVRETRQRMSTWVTALRAGHATDCGLAAVTDVVNIGIGGSDLGPRLLVEALAVPGAGPLRVHFVSNVDAHALTRVLSGLNPHHTLFILASKSFSTQETLLNGELAKRWLVRGGVSDAARHFLAVSANVPAAQAFGLPPAQVLPMWDWVGGRYSVWSAVGLAVALAIGDAGFQQLLDGAALMDAHFRDSPAPRNLPFLLAWTGHLQRNVFGRAAQAVVPYDDRLRLLPMYLQQLEMESLGKSVQLDGQPVTLATVPVLLPGVGTDAQHAFFQALHQGTEVVPVDFIGVLRPDHAEPHQHQVLLANLLAQSAALLAGRDAAAALAAVPADVPATERAMHASHRGFPGNRPSTTFLLDRLDAKAMGVLLALYEHKVYVQSLLWGINAFDQWGVELGKQLASTLLPAIRTGSGTGFDPSTQGLLSKIAATR